MGKEIERRFLVRKSAWDALRLQASSHHAADGSNHGTLVHLPFKIRQGFLSSVKERVVRVRVTGERGMLTVKGPTHGFSKIEFEYAIPLADAQFLLNKLCERPLIEKDRYRVEQDGMVWEVDDFEGENRGLLLAEVELTEESQVFPLPTWVGEEISDDPRYFNSSLIKNPFSQWGSLFT